MHSIDRRSFLHAHSVSVDLLSRAYWLILAFCLMWFVLFSSGCQPIHPEVVQPASETQAESGHEMEIVATAAFSETTVPTDTLLMAQLGAASVSGSPETRTSTLVLGPRSAFPEVPPNAVVLLDSDLVPSNAITLGEIYLSQPWDLPPDQIVVLSSPDVMTGEAPTGDGGEIVTAKPSIVGTLVYTSPTDIAIIPQQLGEDFEMRLSLQKEPIGGVGECIDFGCWCLLCGCCEIPKGVDLSLPLLTDDLVLVPLSMLPDPPSGDDFWILAPTDPIDPDPEQLQLSRRSLLDTLPANSLALISRASLPADVAPVGDLYINGSTDMQPFFESVELDPNLVITNTAGMTTEDGPFAFDIAIESNLPNTPQDAGQSILHVSIDCPECDRNNFCKLDPIGCICLYTPFCESTPPDE